MTPTYKVYVDLNNDNDFSDPNEDISQYVMALEWEIGMLQFDRIARAGRARITVNNAGREFSPGNTSSPFYNAVTKTNLLPMRGIKITMDTGSGETDIFRGLFGIMPVEPGSTQGRTAQLVCTDFMALVRRRRITDFRPRLSYRSDEMILELLNRSILYGNWFLGVAGSSELGTNTYLGGPRFTDTSQIQTGKETFENYPGASWFNERTTIGPALQDIAQSEGGILSRFYFDRQGRPVFWNREYLQTRTDSPTAINADADAIAMPYSWADAIYTHAIVAMTPLVADGVAGVIFTNRADAVKLGPAATRQIRAQFVDEFGVRVGGRDLIRPEIGTDFTLNTEKDGSGTTVTTGVTVRLENRPEHAIITFQSNRTDTVYIRNLQVRGKKLKHYDPLEIEWRDGESEARYGRRDTTIGARFLTDPEVGEGIARAELRARSKPRDVVGSITIPNADAATLALIEGLTIGDLITITETQTGMVTEPYMIVGERHAVSAGGTRHDVTWRVEPSGVYTGWLLGTTGKSELGSTTYLGV